jgi:hypothetical protein
MAERDEGLAMASRQQTNEMPAPQFRVPIPDPTILTTQQLLREMVTLRELLEARQGGLERVIEEQRRDIEKFPSLVEAQVRQLQSLHEEKFNSVKIQFAERDTRTEQTSRDSKVAVDAALQAAKEAVGEQNKSSAMAIAKSEASTTKQIDQIQVLINTTAAGANDKIDDLKTRLTAIEGRTKGMGDGWGYLIGFVAIILAAGSLVVALVGHK